MPHGWLWHLLWSSGSWHDKELHQWPWEYQRVPDVPDIRSNADNGDPVPSSDGVTRKPSSGRNAKDHVGDDESVDTEGSLCVENFVLLFKDKELAGEASIFPGERHQTCNRVSDKGERGDLD